MKTAAYRSYVVRVWSRQGDPARALIEEVQSGARSDLRGERASRLAAILDASLPAESPPQPASEASIPEPAEPLDASLRTGRGSEEVQR